MEMNKVIREEDIPGASLGGAILTIPALKHWLQCRAAPTKGLRKQKGNIIQLLKFITSNTKLIAILIIVCVLLIIIVKINKLIYNYKYKN